jgi:hypothetical protein
VNGSKAKLIIGEEFRKVNVTSKTFKPEFLKFFEGMGRRLMGR